VDDARQLGAERANLRLCKGIYPESPRLAHTASAAINDAYLAAARLLLGGGAFVGFATHDLPLVSRLEAELSAADRPRFEFQALLGVPIRSTLGRLRDTGYVVRLYLPCGPEWYAYSMRRLRENPDMATAIAKSLFSRDRLDAA
jgi:proline dehydrogenase